MLNQPLCQSPVRCCRPALCEAVARAVAGIVSGLVFGGPAGVALAQWMGVSQMLSPAETLLTGSAAASMTAWWVLGALARIADRTGRGPRP